MGVIRTSAAAVLRLMDSFTERPVAPGNVHVQVKQQNQVIWKNDGYVVILKRQGVEQISVVIAGEGYRKKELELDFREGLGPEIFHVWLSPSRKYLFCEDVAIISIIGNKQKLWLACLSEAVELKLMENCEKGSGRIQIWGAGGNSGNRPFLLREGKQEEIVFLLAERHTEHAFALKQPVKRTYHRGKAKIYPVIEAEPDEAGHFWIPYRKLPAKGVRIGIYDETGFCDETELLPGEKKEITLGLG